MDLLTKVKSQLLPRVLKDDRIYFYLFYHLQLPKYHDCQAWRTNTSNQFDHLIFNHIFTFNLFLAVFPFMVAGNLSKFD